MSDMVGKWGRPVAQRGFAQIPNYLLLINQFLDKDYRLTPVELLVLIQLVGGWWNKGDMPFPAMRTLATRCGVSERQIQRSISKLEAKELITKVNRRNKGIIASNAYNILPLVNILNRISEAFPNEFPRNIDKTVIRKISESIGKDMMSKMQKISSDTSENVEEK